jgi:1,4-dihydroxy-2-naphthoyl-CoA hydrolase
MSETSKPASGAAEDLADVLNASLDGWNQAMGIRFVTATADEVIAELEVGPQHLQPYGLVHGGLYAGMIETVTSVGAALDAARRDQGAVGLENHTSFLHAVRAGRLRATARPLQRGRRSQVWEATITDDKGVVAATGRVRLLALERDASVAGQGVSMRPTR